MHRTSHIPCTMQEEALPPGEICSARHGQWVCRGLDPPPPSGPDFAQQATSAHTKGLSRACQGLVKGSVKGLSRACQGLVKGLSSACQGLRQGLVKGLSRALSRACQGLVKGSVKGLSRACQGLVKRLSRATSRACQALVKGYVKGLSRACQGQCTAQIPDTSLEHPNTDWIAVPQGQGCPLGSVSAAGIFSLPFPIRACPPPPPPHQTICPQEGRGDVATSDLVPFHLPVLLRGNQVLLSSHISAYATCFAGEVCSLVWSSWGTSRGEGKLGAKARILNTKVARRANGIW